MPTLDLKTLPDQYHRFAPLIAKLLSKSPSSIIRIHATDRTPQTLCSLLGQVFKALIDFPEFKSAFTPSEIASFRSKHSFRIRSGTTEIAEKGEAYNKIQSIQFEYTSGTITSESYDESRTAIFSSAPASARIFCEYTPERFLALCLLRNESVIESSPTLTNISVNDVVDYSQFTNIVVIESGQNNITIL